MNIDWHGANLLFEGELECICWLLSPEIELGMLAVVLGELDCNAGCSIGEMNKDSSFSLKRLERGRLFCSVERLD